MSFALPLVLASTSTIRATILERAGLTFTVDAASIDEQEVKNSFRAEGREATLCATALAEAKAKRVSRRHPGALVVGADQMLVCDGAWFDKPTDRAAARTQLMALRNRRHELVSAVCVVRDGETLWHCVERSALRMRSFTDDFLERYLADAGDAVLGSVGAYRFEERGIQLFAQISGDYFAILGVPLLPLLEFLRGQGIVAR